MKFGDPYPTTVQKHQILKQSSQDFTLRSLNLWFVNIRRRSKWMDIFKKHAGSKRDVMRDLVARVEAQVAGRPAPNPLPSGAAPPGFKVEQEIVNEIMAMRAVVDMVSREVYGEGWDQILQIKPWTEEEVRAHEERKKMARREARAAKADGEKRRKEKVENKEQRRQSKETRKRVEQTAVEGILAARELHAQLMSANKRKRDDDDAESNNNPAKKSKKGKEVELDENGQPKKTKIRVPKVDEHGNLLTKEQRKALKKTMLAAQAQAQAPANPLKRNQGYVSESTLYGAPAFPAASEQRAPVSHQRTQVQYPSPHPQTQHVMPPPPPPSTSPSQSRPSFPRPQSRSSVPPPSFQPPPPPQQRQRAPGSLWQTPYSQPAQQQQQQQYQPAYSPHPAPRTPHTFPAPPQPLYNEQSYDHRAYTQPDQSPRQREHEVYHQQYAPEPSPIANASALLKQRELEFARAQEELQNRFKREQEEQLARFMQAQEDLRKQLLNDGDRA
ncbi:hypothetical protein FRC07_010277 [Ceratobasidium sp. 392]|nr:hypothetical protein FRC07_010277 [Ceratobasidium sp. 392]